MKERVQRRSNISHKQDDIPFRFFEECGGSSTEKIPSSNSNKLEALCMESNLSRKRVRVFDDSEDRSESSTHRGPSPLSLFESKNTTDNYALFQDDYNNENNMQSEEDEVYTFTEAVYVPVTPALNTINTSFELTESYNDNTTDTACHLMDLMYRILQCSKRDLKIE